MHILVTGAAGMIGRKLAARLVKDGQLNGQKIDRLTLIDVVAPDKPAGFSGVVEVSTSDLSSAGAATRRKMAVAIDFDCQFQVRTIEIYNKSVHAMLSAKLVSEHLSV